MAKKFKVGDVIRDKCADLFGNPAVSTVKRVCDGYIIVTVPKYKDSDGKAHTTMEYDSSCFSDLVKVKSV